MNIDFDSLDLAQKYHLMIQSILPRPIAWTLTRNENKSYNLAPFSFFNGVSADPPVLVMSIGHKTDGSKKDTWANIEREKEFVVHIPSAALAESVTQSSLPLPAGESEIDLTGLEICSRFKKSNLPCLSQAKVAFLCRLYQVMELGPRKQGIVFGEILELYLSDEVASLEKGRHKVDAKAVDPLARLGGNDYSLMGDILTVARPEYSP